ncbi:MAG: cytochrome c5 family protein [Methylotenera sp.]|nr:cytochrome c5 family protein [Methylotenera sp.]
MSNNRDTQGYSFGQIVLASIAGIVGIALFILLVGKLFGLSDTIEVAPPVVANSTIENNIKPVAEVEVATAGASGGAEKSGEEVVKAVCSMCHAAGLMNAPKIGDNAQWSPRIAQGYEALVKHAIEGIRTMPARGGNPALTDGEIASAVAHMANASGAKFKAPSAKAPEAAASETKDTASAPAEAAPVATASVVETPAAAGKSGEEVYKATCAMCHAAGLMNAPKFGDKTQWEPRIKQGEATLVSNATKGIRMMPAKGGNAALTDAEVAGAVKYMANAAGASF